VVAYLSLDANQRLPWCDQTPPGVITLPIRAPLSQLESGGVLSRVNTEYHERCTSRLVIMRRSPPEAERRYGTISMMSVITMADSAQISNKLRPPCSRCGKPLILTCIIPEKPDIELRVYYCASCGANDRVIALVGAAAPDLR
jgi:RNase P subunit RPR2